MDDFFQNSWHRAWSRLGLVGDGGEVRDAVLARYAEPHRKYHTQQHLDECLRLFDTVGGLAERSSEVEIALWFHDAIYDLKSSQNELRSAAWAEEVLRGAGSSLEAAARVRELVLATRHAQLPRTRDEQVLVDIDLAILGAAAERFAEYERQIREEYAYVPGLIFRVKRRAVLRSFLEREPIYSTPALRDTLEPRARRNLAKALGLKTPPA